MTERYSKLLEAWRKERRFTDLQMLPETFYVEMSSYLSELKEQNLLMDKNSLRGRIMDKEIVNAERMLKEVSELRLRKIVSIEMEKGAIVSSTLTPEERILQTNFRGLLSGHEDKLKSILMGRAPQVEAEPQKRKDLMVVRFLQAVPAIMGIDMKTYGPFEAEDVASLPVKNAENLISRGIAKEVKIQK